MIIICYGLPLASSSDNNLHVFQIVSWEMGTIKKNFFWVNLEVFAYLFVKTNRNTWNCTHFAFEVR